MHSSNFTIVTVSENKAIKDEVDNNDTEKYTSCKKQEEPNSAGILPKNEQSCNFLNLHTPSGLYQDDDYKEKLLLPDIFKLTKLDKFNLSTTIENFDTSQPYTSNNIKYQFIEEEALSVSQKPERIKIKQSAVDEKICISPSLNFTRKITSDSNFDNFGQTVQNYSARCKISRKSIIKKELRIKLCRCDFKQSMVNEKTFGTSSPISTEKIEEEQESLTLPSQMTNLKEGIDNEKVIKKNISLKLYTRSISLHTKNNSRVIYRDAIKKIDIDSNGSFKKCVLEKMGKVIKIRDLLKFSIDLTPTYSNIRKYALDKLSSLLNDDIIDSDILITPGMSISDLRYSCISNQYFFKKLRDTCEKIVRDTRATPDNCLSHVFQCRIVFNLNASSNSPNNKIKFYPKKNKFLPKLKELIIDTISNLPNSIIYEIEKIDRKNIVSALFSDVHGVLVSKSLIKNLNLFFSSNKHKFVNLKNVKFDDNLNLLNNLLNKIENLVRESCIFYEGVFLPDESTTEKLSKYILSDIYGISSKVHKKLKLFSQDISKPQESIDSIKLDSNHIKSAVINLPSSSEEEPQTSKFDLISTVDTMSPRTVIKNTNQSEHHIMIKEFNLKSYHRTTLCYKGTTSNIYEDAIKKVIIDNNCRFKNSVLEKLGAYITSRGFTKSSLNLLRTYSNVRKYILDKLSPYINDIIITTDVLISPGISISKIRCNCISNIPFFQKLRKHCEEISESIKEIPDDYFLSIIQDYIYFTPTERLTIIYKKTNLCSEMKSLIIETISNLADNIIHEIKKFKQSEIVNCLFSNIHGIYVTNSFIRKISLFFSSNKIPDNDLVDNLDLLNDLFTRLLIKVKESLILHEGKTFFPGKSTAKLLSKYLLSDMYGISTKFYLELKPQKHIKNMALDTNYTKCDVVDNYNNTEIRLLEKPILTPQKKSQWNPTLITSLNIYELAISMIDIDKGGFEKSFADKINNYPVIKEYLSKKVTTNIDLSITYNNVKNYILEIFFPFLKEIKEETEEKIKPINGMTVDELRLTYISNEDFLNKLREFCNKSINSIKNSSNTTLINLIQYYVPLGIETLKAIRMNKKRKIAFYNDISNLLFKNILNVPEAIMNSIKLLPHTKIIDGCFSHFYDMYVDNKSLLKIKLVFDYVHKKVANDHSLIRVVDKISLDMIDKIRKGNRISKIINSNIISGGLSIYNYIRKLVKEELPLLKDTISDPIFIIRNNKIETVDQKTRNEMFDKLRSDLIETTIRSYNKLCLKKYKTYKSKV
ncbi:putative coiled coil domain protein [Candidatus Ichthyocystis hellenicum]|uniref:Putative coiled coil domain protein n=1 Tax=Candidatus Ichthyocystis hellenicum TaxID=1561003 RepID=A0A0S4M9W6_9BURK|nr:hypothetical protein [Candidatus Ichthyocystis hellenicum]CUT18276.1 putative coiled coil domain protein [Candidatus Ichthyocystis hellenicum]